MKEFPAKFNIDAYMSDVVGRIKMNKKYFFVIFDVEENHELEKNMDKIFFYAQNYVVEGDQEERIWLPNVKLFKNFKV